MYIMQHSTETPIYPGNFLFEFGRECDFIISNNWKMGEAVGISEPSLNFNRVYPKFVCEKVYLRNTLPFYSLNNV